MSQLPEPTEAPSAIHGLALRLMTETYEVARKVIAEQGWSEEEGFRTIFAHGLALLRAERDLANLNRGDANLRHEVERLIRMVMDLDGRYAVMKFRVFELQQENDTLRMNVTGLRGEYELARYRLAHFRADEERLETELARLRAALTVHGGEPHVAATVPAPPPQPAPAPGILRRFGAALRRWRAG